MIYLVAFNTNCSFTFLTRSQQPLGQAIVATCISKTNKTAANKLVRMRNSYAIVVRDNSFFQVSVTRQSPKAFSHHGSGKLTGLLLELVSGWCLYSARACHGRVTLACHSIGILPPPGNSAAFRISVCRVQSSRLVLRFCTSGQCLYRM